VLIAKGLLRRPRFYRSSARAFRSVDDADWESASRRKSHSRAGFEHSQRDGVSGDESLVTTASCGPTCSPKLFLLMALALLR
jgi:hypothetical protein